MNEDELKHQVRSCFGKKRYSTEDIALKTIKKIVEQRPVVLRVYSCPVCQGFHLTSKGPN